MRTYGVLRVPGGGSLPHAQIARFTAARWVLAWRRQRGLLATPAIVPRLLQQQYLLLDR